MRVIYVTAAIAALLTPVQLSEAKRLASEWKPH